MKKVNLNKLFVLLDDSDSEKLEKDFFDQEGVLDLNSQSILDHNAAVEADEAEERWANQQGVESYVSDFDF